eukprot:m.22222 g.22222  ORF g.22222 m.22222 type:complete len:598 (+) comp10683_c0_seq1:33-1826(+)
MDVSLSERGADVWEKVTQVGRVAVGILPGGPFRFGTVDVRGIPTRVFLNLPDTLGEYYRLWFQKYAERDWLVHGETRISFREARRIYLALGVTLRGDRFNIQPGDRVGIAMRNYPEFLLAFLGVTAVGGVAVPLNSLWVADELEYGVKNANCKVLICDPERLDRASGFLQDAGIKTILCQSGTWIGDKKNVTMTWEDAILVGNRYIAHVIRAGGTADKLEDSMLRSVEPEDEGMIMFTSGSTGKPKGVVHTQRSIGTAMKMAEMAGVATGEQGGEQVQLMAVPLFHITALYAVGLYSIPNGTRVVMMRKWDAGEALNVIERERVTRFTGVPTMMRDLLEHPDFSPERTASLTSTIAGGAPVPPAQVASMRKKSKAISAGQGYGMTETMGLGTINRGADYLRNPTSCGRPVPIMIELKVVDVTTGAEVPEGARGEVCIKGATVMKEYHGLPEKTAEAIDSQGFFHTGDIGKYEGGFVFILDRIKDMIIRGGENIDCSEVEAALTMHPAARECSVFGLPDARLGEVVGAAIWCTDPTVSKEDILAVAAKRIAKFKIPVAANVWFHSEELPKGATGKIDKKGMRDKYGKLVAARPLPSKV